MKNIYKTLITFVAVAVGVVIGRMANDGDTVAKEVYNDNMESVEVEPSERDNTPSVAGTTTTTGDLLTTTVIPGSALSASAGDFMSLERVAYKTVYNPAARLPVWVAWHLTSAHTDGPFKREGIKFAEDEDVPQPRATNMDYVNSGYDRGHMCPSGDNRWSREAQKQSFLYTNCCPQLHNLNSGDWRELEEKCRLWAQVYGDLYIVCGPLLLNKQHKTIGKNKVVVPEAFFKVVLRMKDQPEAIGFIYRNERNNKTMSSYVNSVDQVERITGLDFFSALSDDVEKKVEASADLSNWIDDM